MPRPLLRSGARRVNEFENSRQLVFRNADAGVVHIDPDFRPPAAAADQDASSRLRVSYRIGHQIAEDASQQHWIAHQRGIRCNGSEIDAPLNSGIFVFVPKPPEQGPKSDSGNLKLIGRVQPDKRHPPCN